MKTRKQKTEEQRMKAAKRKVDFLLKKGEISFQTEFFRLEPEPKQSKHKRNARYCWKLNRKGNPMHYPQISARMYKYFLTLKAKSK